MSLLPLFEALGRSAPGVFLRDSTPAFAVTEAVHLIALSLIGGIVTVVGLSAAGILLPRAGAGRFAASLRPWMIGAVAAVIISGLMLVAAGPYKYYTNPVFWWKMALLLAAIVGYVVLDLWIARSTPQRLFAAAILPLWLSVAIAGRVIGLI